MQQISLCELRNESWKVDGDDLSALHGGDDACAKPNGFSNGTKRSAANFPVYSSLQSPQHHVDLQEMVRSRREVCGDLGALLSQL